jgi:hypothetical protein
VNSAKRKKARKVMTHTNIYTHTHTHKHTHTRIYIHKHEQARREGRGRIRGDPGTLLLPCCCNFVTTLLHFCPASVTIRLQCCYSGFASAALILIDTLLDVCDCDFTCLYLHCLTNFSILLFSISLSMVSYLH